MSGGYRKWQEPSSVRSRSWQRFLAELFRGLRISRLPQGGEQSLVSYRLFVTTVFSLLSFPFFWQRLSSPSFGPLERRHLTRGALRNYTGDIELDQPWCQGALLWLRVARFPSGFVRRRFLRVCRWFHFHQKARESLALVRLRKLDPGVLICIKSAHSRLKTGSRSFSSASSSEEFLNSEVASEVPAVLLVVQAGFAGASRGHLRRGFCEGAHYHHGLRKHPWPPCRGEMAMWARLCRRWFF